jgi:hypothetical protein
MKIVTKAALLSVFLLTLILFTNKGYTATLYSTGNADWKWTTPGSWTTNSNGSGSCGCIPTGGDIINIRVGDSISIPSNINVGAAAVTVNVYGVINITGFLDLLSTGSVVNIYPGAHLSSNGSASSKLRIGGTASAEYTGSDGTITGPWTISNGSSAANGTLPVELLSFKASNNNSTVKLEWKTGQEENNDFFEVQSSSDGINFVAIGRIEANESHTYSYSCQCNGLINYYRLKQVDLDGKYSMSEIIRVNSENAFDLRIFPNPASGSDYSFSFYGTRHVLLVVFDIHGQQLFSKTITFEEDNIVTANDINSNLSPGIYYIHASSDGELINKKLIIQ